MNKQKCVLGTFPVHCLLSQLQYSFWATNCLCQGGRLSCPALSSVAMWLNRMSKPKGLVARAAPVSYFNVLMQPFLSAKISKGPYCGSVANALLPAVAQMPQMLRKTWTLGRRIKSHNSMRGQTLRSAFLSTQDVEAWHPHVPPKSSHHVMPVNVQVWFSSVCVGVASLWGVSQMAQSSGSQTPHHHTEALCYGWTGRAQKSQCHMHCHCGTWGSVLAGHWWFSDLFGRPVLRDWRNWNSKRMMIDRFPERLAASAEITNCL